MSSLHVTDRRHRLWLLLVAVFFDLLGVAFVVPLFPQFAKSVGMDAAMVGSLSSIYGAAQLVGAPMMGRISDTYGRKAVLLVSCIGACASYLLTDLATSVAALFFSRITVGLFKQTTSAAQAYVSDVTTAAKRAGEHKAGERYKHIGRIETAVALAFIVGPPLGGWLAKDSTHVAVFAATGCFVIEFVLVGLFLPESLDKNAAKVAPKVNGKDKLGKQQATGCRAFAKQFTEIVAAFRDPGMQYVMILTAFAMMQRIMYQTTLLVSLQERFDLDAQGKGFVWSYAAAIRAFYQGVAVGPMARWFNRQKLLVVCFSGLSVSLFLSSLTVTLTQWCVTLAASTFFGSVLSTVLTGAATEAVEPSKVGQVLGMIGSLSSVSRVVAPFLGGVIIQTFGASAVDTYSAASGALAAVLALHLHSGHAAASEIKLRKA